MSFEGFYQYLCKNGHAWLEDCYMADPNDAKCPKCNHSVYWSNLVDETNGAFDEDDKRIDGYVELEIERETRCEACDSILETVYKIPGEKKQ